MVALVCAAGCAPAWSQQSPTWEEPPTWYGTLALGKALSVEDTRADIQLSGPPVPIRLDGTLFHDGGSVGSLAFGRQGRRDPDKPDEQPLFWRLEGEWWSARLDRERFEAGIVSAPLNDRARAQGLFLNGLIRVAATEKTQWWLGAGLGWAKVNFPLASAYVPGCGCLPQASSNGAALRLKAVAERKMGDSSALFLELSHVNLSGSSSSPSGQWPLTTYSHPGVTSIALGWRVRF